MELTVDTGVLSAFTLLWLVIVPTPGANSLMVTHVAMTRPGDHVAIAILGNMGGILSLALAALLGWATLLDTLPWLRLTVQILGAAYLIYFGWRLIVRSRAPAAGTVPARQAEQDATPYRRRQTLTLGYLTAVSNPQAIAFITSIYAVTGVLQASMATGLASIVIMIGCNATYLALLGWLFQRRAVRTFYARFRPAFEGTVGALFVLLGLRLIYRETNS